jgi:Flp pilus assembly protein TadB
MKQALSPPVTRYLVLGPTLALSVILGNLGWSPLPRVTACVALGAFLILLVARYQRSRLAS